MYSYSYIDEPLPGLHIATYSYLPNKNNNQIYIALFTIRFRGARSTQLNHCQLSNLMQITRFLPRVMVHYSCTIGTLKYKIFAVFYELQCIRPLQCMINFVVFWIKYVYKLSYEAVGDSVKKTVTNKNEKSKKIKFNVRLFSLILCRISAINTAGYQPTPIFKCSTN